MVRHDIRCQACGKITIDILVSGDHLPDCPSCGSSTEIEWHTPRIGQRISVHSSERAVVYRNPRTGSIAYPPVNNEPMPERYAKGGYERVELDTLHKLDTFCAQNKLVNEKASFDNSGNADNL